MPWVALDDRFHSHPKVVTAGLEGAGLYACALSYCGAYLTDGFVPMSWVATIAPKKLRDKVTAAGLWEECEDGMGYRIPDYLTLNPSREKVESKRERDRLRKDSARNPRGSVADSSVHSPSPSPSPVPVPSTASRQLYESLDPGRKRDVDRILERITGADDRTPNVIAFYAQSLPEGALAKVRESVENQTGELGPGWVVNALKDEGSAAA